jgi:hypothetical protein
MRLRTPQSERHDGRMWTRLTVGRRGIISTHIDPERARLCASCSIPRADTSLEDFFRRAWTSLPRSGCLTVLGALVFPNNHPWTPQRQVIAPSILPAV